ncbi:unnamed protein product [Phytophthora fragariaefolia]|uniref:Unnamed protein product n=1 Tax=Phytophthora fragariaefolia TaxID=1490495 RepID=A0A9W6XUX3_9STRA|nr:unnamed protein product [Phytophthora fragariaefolia]
MSPSQASSDDFPRLSGARNFDVWKARVSASLDGKHLLGFVTKKDYNGVSDEEDESDMSDIDNDPKAASHSEPDSDEVDFEDSSDELRPSDNDDANPSTKKAGERDHSPIRSFANRKTARKPKPAKNERPSPPAARQLRCMEAQT